MDSSSCPDLAASVVAASTPSCASAPEARAEPRCNDRMVEAHGGQQTVKHTNGDQSCAVVPADEACTEGGCGGPGPEPVAPACGAEGAEAPGRPVLSEDGTRGRIVGPASGSAFDAAADSFSSGVVEELDDAMAIAGDAVHPDAGNGAPRDNSGEQAPYPNNDFQAAQKDIVAEDAEGNPRAHNGQSTDLRSLDCAAGCGQAAKEEGMGNVHCADVPKAAATCGTESGNVALGGGLASSASPPPANGSSARCGEGAAPSAGEAVETAGPERIWRKRHNKRTQLTDSDPAWYEHKRHVLVFTYSGKPVFTRYGAEEGLSNTTGALSAIVSKFATFFFASSGQDVLRYFLAGDHVFAFVEKGPFWLVCISCCGDTYRDMVRMLDRIYLQQIALLTTGIERTLQNRPSYDMRRIMDGTESVFNSLIRWCTQDVFLQFEGFEPLPLPPPVRSSAVDALKSAKIPDVFCAWLMAGHRLVSLVSSKLFRVNGVDLSLLINIVMSSASLRTAESWTPVCLPHLNDKAFAYAYISFLAEGSDVALVFLSMKSEGEQFYAISTQAAQVKASLERTGCMEAIGQAMALCPISLRTILGAGSSVADPFQGGASSEGEAAADAVVPPALLDKSGKRIFLAPVLADQWKLLGDVIHAAYYVPSLQQYFSTSVAQGYTSRRQVKMLFRNYGRCRNLLANAVQPAQLCVATDHECFYVSLSAEFQLYLAVPRGISTSVIGQFYQWVKSQEANIFLAHQPTW